MNQHGKNCHGNLKAEHRSLLERLVLGAAIDFLQEIGLENILEHEHKLS